MPSSSESSQTWRVLWAKSEPRHPLWKHLLDAAAVSLALRNPLERDGWRPEATAWLVGMHDVGKADPAFQRMHEPFRPELEAAGFPLAVDDRVRHERVSAAVLRAALIRAGGDERFAESVAMSIAAHHGRWVADARASGDAFERAQDALSGMLSTALGGAGVTPTRPADLSAFGIRLAGHVVLCDWIASNEAFFNRSELRDCGDPAEYFARARAVANEMIEKLDLRLDEERGMPEQVVEHPRPLQRCLLEACLAPGLAVVEAPMGEGKTEAAWILAEQWRDAGEGYHGAYMALPTQATGDAMFERYEQDYLKKLGRAGKVRLIHGMAWLRDAREPEERFVTYGERGDDAFAAQWFRPTRRAMLAAHGAGTVDQFLLAGMNARFGFLRLYGLSRRVLVVDEVHAYDAYMTAVLRRGLAWCRAMRIPVILLSATLSAKQRAQLLEAYGAEAHDPGPEASYPLVTHVGFEGSVSTLQPSASSDRELEITTWPGVLGDAAATARLAEDLSRPGRCVCVIANTVRQAQMVYQALELPAGEKGLFHARFTSVRRERIAGEVVTKFGKDRSQRPGRYVLVATQVVEQSLDVDFDEMVSEIAPMDLLLQRSGRLHRHVPRSHKPELHILLPEPGTFRFGGTERVYDRYVLLRTLALVHEQRQIRLPECFRTLIEAVYGGGTVPEGVVPAGELVKAEAKWISGIAEMAAAAEPFLLGAPTPRLFRPVGNDPVGDDSDDGNGWRAKTRLGANDRTCLFVRKRNLDRTLSGVFPMHVVRELYRHTVRVPGYLRLDEPAPGYEAAVQAEGMLRGLTLIPYTDEKEWKGSAQQLRYDDDLGLVVEKA